MSNSSNIKKNIADNNIKNLYLQFTDINGKVKYLNLPVEQIDNILNGEIQFDGSFTENSRENNTLDLKLIPDLSTFIILPFKTLNELPTASFICDICHSDGTPFEGCPRSNLKKIINNANSQGYKMMIAPEIEFFMFPQNKQEKPNSINTDTTGYYDLAPSENYEETILNILNALEKIGIKVEASHHEGAPYQHEIDLDFCEILKTADNLIMFKFISKYIANKYGYNLTFMPKPVYGKNGSGLHLNLILTDLNGKNLLCNEYDTKQLSKTAKNIIGSLL